MASINTVLACELIMERNVKIEKNYKMMIAGKERIIPFVQLVESRFGGNFNIPNKEFKRVSFIIAKQICFSAEQLEFDELEFLRATFELKQYEIAEALNITPSGLSHWKKRKLEEGLSEGESQTLKSFFRRKLIDRTVIVSKDKAFIDFIIRKIRDNIMNDGVITSKTPDEIEKLLIGKLVDSEFDIKVSTPLSEDLLEKSKEYNIDDQDYTFDDEVESTDYKDEYLQTLAG